MFISQAEDNSGPPGQVGGDSGKSSSPSKPTGENSANIWTHCIHCIFAYFEDAAAGSHTLFTKTTRAIVWGLQSRAVQGMMDFDYVCGREEPSVACMVYPMAPGDSKQNFYWGHKEVLVPVYKNMADAMAAFPEADVMISFASLRSAYDSTLECLEFPQIRTIAIIAEGIPENYTRKLIKVADSKKVTIIGPATVGGVKPGCFKIGNTGGMMDNILHSNLYRPGSVAYLSRSGGMSNELNIIISQTTVCTRAWPSWATLTCSPPTRSSGMPEPEPALGPPRRPPRPRMLLWAAREAVVPPSFDELGDKIRKVKTGTIGGAVAPRPHGLQLG